MSNPASAPTPERFSRRAAISSALAAAGGAAAFGTGFAAPAPDMRAAATARAAKRYEMKKSINLWAFPYPEKMSLQQCLQLAKDAGFDSIKNFLHKTKSSFVVAVDLAPNRSRFVLSSLKESCYPVELSRAAEGSCADFRPLYKATEPEIVE